MYLTFLPVKWTDTIDGAIHTILNIKYSKSNQKSKLNIYTSH